MLLVLQNEDRYNEEGIISIWVYLSIFWVAAKNMKSRTKRLLREFNIKAERLREYKEDMNFKFKHMRDCGMLSNNR